MIFYLILFNVRQLELFPVFWKMPIWFLGFPEKKLALWFNLAESNPFIKGLPEIDIAAIR
jgi:hypothetical protein